MITYTDRNRRDSLLRVLVFSSTFYIIDGDISSTMRLTLDLIIGHQFLVIQVLIQFGHN